MRRFYQKRLPYFLNEYLNVSISLDGETTRETMLLEDNQKLDLVALFLYFQNIQMFMSSIQLHGFQTQEDVNC